MNMILVGASAIALTLGAGLASVLAASPGETDGRVTVDDLTWLEGRWVGTGLGGTIEEVFQAPAGGAMPGTFRLVREGRAAFYEFILIENNDDGVHMLLHHFNPGMERWEDEPVAFDLIDLGSREAIFAERDDAEENTHLRYVRENDALVAELIEDDGDGGRRIAARFDFRLAPATDD